MSRLIMRGVLGSVVHPKIALGSIGSIRYYNGEQWSLHSVFGSSYVYALDVDGDKIFAGGLGSRLKLYDGTSWVEQTPAGALDKSWKVALITGSKMLAGIQSGRLYFHNGSSWSELQLLGNADKFWYSGYSYKGKFVVTTYPGRIHYYDGTSWSEIMPYGGVDANIRNIGFDEYNIIYSLYNDYVYVYNFASQTTTQHKPIASVSTYGAVGINGSKLYAGIESSGRMYEYNGSSWSAMNIYGGANTAFRATDFMNNRGIISKESSVTEIYFYNGSAFETMSIPSTLVAKAAIHY